MNFIVVGASHHSAPIALLERLSQVGGSREMTGDHVAEAVVLTTCNRTDVYAAVPAFHAGLQQIGEALGRSTGLRYDEFASSLYVHHGVDAVRHTFRVAAGLESMVPGEAQILGQLRDAYQHASEADTVGKVLHELMQQALRVGKRAHAETGIDQAPRSMVTAALDLVPHLDRPTELSGHKPRVILVGAGAMGSLALADLSRRGIEDVTVVNRSGSARRLDELPRLLEGADIVVTATASLDPVITRDMITKPLVIVDLAMPRDVEPGIADLPGITLIDLEHLNRVLPAHAAELDGVARIVEAEVEAYTGWLRGAQAAPTVAALRARADDVIAAELSRLRQRRPELSDNQRAEVAHTVHRVVQRLLHQPTVRVRQLAAEPGGETYTRLVRELFELDITTTTVSQVPEVADR